MEDAWDYNIDTQIVLDISELYKGDLNAIGADSYVEKVLTEWVYKSFNIADWQQEDVPIEFMYTGSKVTVSFTFELCDDSKEEAESFVDYCIRTCPFPDGIRYFNHAREATETGTDSH